MKTFTMTDDHIKLLKRMSVSWDDCEYGAPSIDPKRPYGNSDVVGDIAEILEWEPALDEDELGDRVYAELEEVYEQRASRVHEEMQTVLQILVRHPEGIEPGEYRVVKPYSRDWERV